MPNIPIEMLERILDRNLRWIAAADSKVAPTLAITTAMLGTLAAFLAASTTLTWFPVVLVTGTVGLLLASIAFLVTAVFPRLRGPTDSIIFFGAIAKLPKTRYIAKISSASEGSLYHDFVVQVHRNAQIALLKYTAVRRAMAFLLLAFCLGC